MNRLRIPLGDALDELIDHRGKTPRKLGGDWQTEGHRVVSALNIKNGRVDSNDHHYISSQMYDKWMRVPLRAGDVLLTSEAPAGEVAYISEDVDWAIGQRLFALRGKAGILNGRYLSYLLRGGPVRHQLMSRTTGTTVAGIRQSELVKINLDLPPFDIQMEVAETLGAFDDKIESNRREVAVGESLIRAIVESTLDSSEGRVGVLSDYCTLVKAPVKAEMIASNDNYFGLEHMPRGSIFLSRWDKAEGLASNKTKFQRGDVLFGKLRPYFKKVGIAPVDGVCSTDILAVRPRDPRDLALVAVIASSSALIDSVTAGATGTRMPRASWKDLASWSVPLITTTERAALSERTSPMIERLVQLTFESHRLAALRDVLLPELISGRMRTTGAVS
ncbi:restriction endonuclease subunit S [Brachybacterium sp. MASK1Z-5]|uniref:Restriction endonuclease subunit S n=1 Tax=Brachybacterium halotolerans TaxID=2795215 RepID=A0ABS1BD40_9MICO|nr:restriction endonuclease subunit S [Brachybacterium halotolerans]